MELFYYFIFFYAILPNIYLRYFSKSVIKKIKSDEKIIALTFDDGPEPNYTPELLDVLKKHNVKGTFFILADKASKYPQIVKRIMDEGHNIGLHCFKHISEVFLSPLQTRKYFLKSLGILEQFKIDVSFFRPPWGIFNPFTYYFAKISNWNIILWSKHAMDWSMFVTKDFIEKRLVNNVESGDIILLHDGRGRRESPKRTIEALDAAIPVLKKNGYKFVLAKDLDKYKKEAV